MKIQTVSYMKENAKRKSKTPLRKPLKGNKSLKDTVHTYFQANTDGHCAHLLPNKFRAST